MNLIENGMNSIVQNLQLLIRCVLKGQAGYILYYYYTSLSFFLYKNITVVLLFHPKINRMTIPPVVPVKNCRTIPLCGNFSNHISRIFLIHSFDWFKLNDVMQVLGRFHCAS